MFVADVHIVFERFQIEIMVTSELCGEIMSIFQDFRLES